MSKSVRADGAGAIAIGGDAINSIFVTGGVNQFFVGHYERLADAYLNPRALYRELQLESYVGRAWLVQTFDRFLDATDRGYFVIEGEAGIGKTAFIAWLARERRYVHHFVRLMDDSDNVGVALRSLSAQLIRACRSRIVVLPSASLADLVGVRARARVRLDELGDRRTILEGYLACILSVEPDGALAAGIYSGNQWHEIKSPPSTVPLGRWVDAAFSYDVRDTVSLSLDSIEIASRVAVFGKVGSIAWPYGLNIGAWPDRNLRMFNRRMTDMWLWRFAP